MDTFAAQKLIKTRCLLPLITLLLFTLGQPGSAGAEALMIPLHIQEGTNLIHLARDFCRQRSDWKTIAAVNRLSPPYLILAGSTLKVPLDLLKVEQLQTIIAKLHGRVLILDRLGKQSAAQEGDRLLPGQSLVTAEESYAQLVFPDHRHTRVEANSRLTLNYLIRLNDGSVKTEPTLHSGRLINTIEKPLQANDTHRTSTPIAVTGVRGTSYRIKAAPTASTIETLSGQVAVNAAGAQLTLKAGQGSRVRPGRPPETARPLPAPPASPQLQPLYRLLPAQIPAPNHPRAARLRLRLCWDEQGKATVRELFAQPGQTFFLDQLEDGSYSAFLTAIDREGFEGRASGPFPLRIRTIPAAPLIALPKDQTRSWEAQMTIQWLRGEQVDHFSYQLATDPDFKEIIEHNESREDAVTTPALAPASYYFRVQGVSADGFTTLFSPVVAFTIIPQPAMEAVTTKASEELTLQWSAMAPGCSYDLQISEDPSFKTLILERSRLATTSYTVEQHLLPGRYYVRLRGVLDEATRGPWTPAQTLTIEADPPGWEELLMAAVFFAIILL
ncbi:FecR domain-containing protein [Desulfogranum mediterraneum]|uniref:FecR domain-containing protein n=1 Tax=Desulfogranum mediterraneum TaxID=160661 RepID=UPI00048A7F98|nr:FecR domain-containing protein [Desulfogranum mediterraneum]